MTKELSNFLNSNDAIFHYTKKETAMEYILNDKKLKFGFFHSTNDPYEYRRKSIKAFDSGNIDESLWLNSINLIDNTILNTAFLSFCTKRNGYKKPRMWSQYGQNHSGVCLVFSKKSLIETIKNELSQNYLIYNEDVKYKSKIYNDNLNIHNNNLTLNEIIINHIKQDYKNIFFQKHSDYKDENEFRIILVQKNENNFFQNIFIDISNSIKFIILGDNFPKEYLPTINNLSSKLNIEYKSLCWEHNQYFLLE